MFRKFPLRAIGSGLVLATLLSLCGLVVLGENAQRDWSLHWNPPTIVLPSTSSFDYSAVTTARGWDIAWTDLHGRLILSSFDSSGRRVRPDITLRGSPTTLMQSLTLGHAENFDVVAWRQDTANGSTLRTATVDRRAAPVYSTVAGGNAPIEHPIAFTDGHRVGVVFSWQRPQFNVFLTTVGHTGRASAPLALTRGASYAFAPHAVMDSPRSFRLAYFDQCCSASAFDVRTGRYTLAGMPMGPSQSLARDGSIAGQGTASSPNRWGIDLSSQGRTVWLAWSGDQGLTVASWQGGVLAGPPRVIVPNLVATDMALATAGTHMELVWLQPFDLGTYLGAVSFAANGQPLGDPDRVAFESASDDVPFPISVGGLPGVLWQAQPGKSSIIRIEMSRFSPTAITAPTLQARIGLGLANPLSSLGVLAVGSLLFALVLAVANILLIIIAVLVFVFLFRGATGTWKYYAYLLLLAGAMYLLFVALDAPSPPVLFLSGVSGPSATVTITGMILFVLIVMSGFLRSIENVFRVGLMTFAAFYFISFLQAIVIIQAQIGKN